MNKWEFSDKLRALLAPLEIEDVEIVSVPDVGNIMRFRIKVEGGVKYGSFTFDQLSERLLADVVRKVKDAIP